MVAAVVFDDQLACGVIEVGPADEPAFGISELGLDLRSRQPRVEDVPTQSGLHRGFGGFGQVIEPAETQTQGRVSQDEKFDRGQSPAQIAKGLLHSRRAQATYSHPIYDGVPDRQATSRARARAGGNNHLDWVAGINVEAMQPCRSQSSEEGV